MKHTICQPAHVKAPGLIGLELELPEISVEVPSPAEISRHTAVIVAESLKRTIQAGQDARGNSLRPPAQSTLERRLRDKYPPARPRSNRWIERYPGRVRAMLAGTLTPGVMKTRVTRWQGKRSGWKRTTRFKNLSVSQLAAVDSGTLWQRIKLAASGAGSCEVEAPPGRPIDDIERVLGAKVFTATDAHLSESMDGIMAKVFASWDGGSGAGPALRRSLSGS